MGRASNPARDRWLELDPRSSIAKKCDRDAKLCGGTDAARTAFPRRRFGAHRAANRRQGAQPGGCGRSHSGARVGPVLLQRDPRLARSLFGDLPAAGVDGATILLGDDFDAALISWKNFV